MQRLRALALLPLWLLTACKPQRMVDPPVTLDTVAKAYVRLAVALGEHDPDSIDYYAGPPEWVADIRKSAPSLAEIRRTSLEQSETLQGLPMHDQTGETRKRFLVGQLQAITCRAGTLAGVKASFDLEAMCAFGFTAPAKLDDKTLADARARIAALIGGQGNPAKRYAAFEAQYVIPPNRLPAAMARAIAGCRAQTLRHMRLPPDEAIELRFAGHEPWAGYSLYLGGHKSIVTINTDFPVTIDRALDLACHETYPGHHTWNLTQDDALARHGAIEMLVQPTYSAQSFRSEAAAMIASEIAFSPAERARFEREDLFPVAGLPTPSEAAETRYLQVEQQVARLQPAIAVVARSYLDGDLEFARAQKALEDEVLMSDSFESLKYLNEFRVYIVTYTVGPEVLNQVLNRSLPQRSSIGAEEVRWNTYLHWMTSESTLTPSARQLPP